MIEPRYRWLLPPPATPPDALLAAGAELGLGPRAVRLLAARGVATRDDLSRFVAPPVEALHDPRLLPDAQRLVARVAAAVTAGERVLVFGDFDADGLTGLAIIVVALRRLGLEVVPYVPSRLDEGHGLSVAGIEAAVAAGATLIVTVDTGSSSAAEVEEARRRGIDVIVTDHHRVPAEAPAAVAFVNPHRVDSTYPDARLAGSGVAFKVAQLLLGGTSGHGLGVSSGRPEVARATAALDLADLAAIGTVADLAPLVGENRAIARLGLEVLRAAPRPGIAALLGRAGVIPATVDIETVGFVIAPRLNAAGRVGEAMDAARLLLATDPAEAEALADDLDAANLTRRDLTRQALAEAREALRPGSPLAMARGPWPVGVVGLVAARLAEETARPAVVGAELGEVVRASCRSAPGVDLAALLQGVSDLLVRHGGHAGAAGFEVRADRWAALAARLEASVSALVPPDPRPTLALDLVLPAAAVDYGLVAELGSLAPFGPGHADPLVLIKGLSVSRVRTASGGHTQVVLRRRPDVLDGIAFGRDDLAAALAEGDEVEVVARVVSRSFAGVESLQLEIRDVGPAGWSAGLAPLDAVPSGVTRGLIQPSGA